MKAAEADFSESLDIRRELAKENPSAFRPELALTLIGRGSFFILNNQSKKAEADFSDALDIQRAVAEENPDVFGDTFARNVLLVAGNFQAIGNFRRACTVASEQLPSSVSTDLLNVINAFKLKMCSDLTQDTGQSR